MIARIRQLRAAPIWLLDVEIDAVHTQRTLNGPGDIERHQVGDGTANTLWATVEHVLARHPRGVRRIGAHIPDHHWTVARLPITDGSEPRQAMRQHLASCLPDGMEHYTYAVHVSRPSGSPVAHAFISQKHVMEGLVDRAKEAKLKVHRVQPRIISLINAATQGQQLDAGLNLIVDRSASAITLAVVRNGQLERCRIVPQADSGTEDDLELAHIHATAEAYGAARQQPLSTLATPRAVALFSEPDRVQTLAVQALEDPDFHGIHTALRGLAWTDRMEDQSHDS